AGQAVGGGSLARDSPAGRPAQVACCLCGAQLRCRRRLDLVWARFPRTVPARRGLCRPHPQGREACRPSGAGTDQVRAGSQPQDREDARAGNPDNRARPRRRGDRVKRRAFITLVGGAAAWPLAARAQQPAMPLIGVLRDATAAGSEFAVNGLRKGLAEAGFVEGQNLTIEYAWTDGQSERLSALAAELVGRHVPVIVSSSLNATYAAKAATSTIPVVF